MGQIKPTRLAAQTAKQPNKTTTNPGNWDYLATKFNTGKAYENFDRNIAEELAKLETKHEGFSSPLSRANNLKSSR